MEMDWLRIDIGLEWISNGLALDWHWIGNGLALDWLLIDVELALDWPWIGSWLTSDWRLIDMNPLWIGIALATGSRQNGMVWH